MKSLKSLSAAVLLNLLSANSHAQLCNSGYANTVLVKNAVFSASLSTYSNNYPTAYEDCRFCTVRSVKFWVPGRWERNHCGKLKWIHGYWEYRTEKVLCNAHNHSVSFTSGGNEIIYENISHSAPVMSDIEFRSLLNDIASRSFESSRLTIAKQGISGLGVLSEQVKQIMFLFDFESTRLEFAKFAYNKTIDPQRYFVVNDAFDFDSSVYELDNFIRGGR